MATRDYLTIDSAGATLIITCDSTGGIGEQEYDVVKIDGYVVGRFLTRVALMELLAVGGSLLALSCTLSVDPLYAECILQGVIDEAKLAHPDPSKILVASTEKNIPTRQTGTGITCIGSLSGNQLRVGLSKAGDAVLAFGLPKVGPEVRLDDPEIADTSRLRQLLRIDGVRDIIPVGSQGIQYEADLLAECSGLTFSPCSGELDLKKSAGPGTVVLFSYPVESLAIVKSQLTPVSIIGYLEEVK